MPTKTVRVLGAASEWLAGLLTISPVVRAAAAEFLSQAAVGVLAAIFGLLFTYLSTFFDRSKGAVQIASFWFFQVLHFASLTTASYLVLLALFETVTILTVGVYRRLKLLLSTSAPPARPPGPPDFERLHGWVEELDKRLGALEGKPKK